DTHIPEDTPFKSEDFSSNGYSLSSDAGDSISHSQTDHQNRTGALQHQASELQNHMAEFQTVFPESQGVKHPQSLDPISSQEVTNLSPDTSSDIQVGKPSASFLTTQYRVLEPSSTTPLPTTTTRPGSHTTSLQPSGAKPTTVTTTASFLPTVTVRATPDIPAAAISVTHLPLSALKTSASTSTTKWVTTSSRSATAPSGQKTAAIPPEPTVVSSNDTSHVPLLSFSGFALSASNSPMASQNNPQGYNPSDSESYLSERVLRGEVVTWLEEKSSLVAALLLGMIFLLLVIVLTGKKIHESVQKRRYTRLDYLINGIYADV
ncbi:MANS1 protein, partial [Urocolius indicus]|nr:MANS1 protein [Urocolius indicus]